MEMPSVYACDSHRIILYILHTYLLYPMAGPTEWTLFTVQSTPVQVYMLQSQTLLLLNLSFSEFWGKAAGVFFGGGGGGGGGKSPPRVDRTLDTDRW